MKLCLHYVSDVEYTKQKHCHDFERLKEDLQIPTVIWKNCCVKYPILILILIIRRIHMIRNENLFCSNSKSISNVLIACVLCEYMVLQTICQTVGGQCICMCRYTGGNTPDININQEECILFYYMSIYIFLGIFACT